MDGPGRGGAPLPWDMEEPPANMFKEEVLTLLVMVMARKIMIQLYVCSNCHRFPIVGIKLLVPFPGAGGDCAPHWGGEGLPQVSRDGRHVLQGLLWQGEH